MTFELYNDLVTPSNQDVIWIEKGIYPIIRFFDKRRIVIDLGTAVNGQRQITIVPKNRGRITAR